MHDVGELGAVERVRLRAQVLCFSPHDAIRINEIGYAFLGAAFWRPSKASNISVTNATIPQLTNPVRTPNHCVMRPTSNGPTMSPNSLKDCAAPMLAPS